MEKKIKVGLVGARANGGWSPVAHIPALKVLENIELAAVCTSRTESAKLASKAYNVKRVYSDYNELIAQEDIDLISVVVKIPNHYEVVKAALHAGKHVFCEWPLGNDLNESEELTLLAKEKGVVTTIGLQGQHSPELNHIKELVASGWLGELVSAKMVMQTTASYERDSQKAWENEIHRNATLFSICGGHTLYYFSRCLDDITEVSAQMNTSIKQITLKDTGAQVNNPIADQIFINGTLINDIPFSIEISAIPFHSNGWRMEVYGTRSTIIATSPMLPQFTPIELMSAKGMDKFEHLKAPKYNTTSNILPEGPPKNVGQNYNKMAEAIKNNELAHPSFADALLVHKLLETIQKSSDEKRTIKIE